MSDDGDKGYRVLERDGLHCVVSPGGSVIMKCRDAPSARHYEDLLKKAFDAGYKAGYRAAREDR